MGSFIAGLKTVFVGIGAFIVGMKVKAFFVRSELRDIQSSRKTLWEECEHAKDLNNKTVSNFAEMCRVYDEMNGIDTSGKFTDRDEWLMSLWLD